MTTTVQAVEDRASLEAEFGSGLAAEWISAADQAERIRMKELVRAGVQSSKFKVGGAARAQGPGAKAILEAYREAKEAAFSAVLKALICGQLMVEQRQAMSFCHRGKNLAWQGATKAEEDKFCGWLEENCAEVPQRTAYRWMEMAERVCEALGLPTTFHLTPALSPKGGEGAELPLSRVLLMEPGELPAEAARARSVFFEFTSGKTMKECLAAVVVDGDEAHRITRAANGQKGGYCGEDRKAFEVFVKNKLSQMTTHLVVRGNGKPWRERDLEADQKTAIAGAFDAAISQWPRWLLETVKAASARELRLAEEERRGRA